MKTRTSKTKSKAGQTYELHNHLHFRKAARQLSDENRKRLALVLNTIEAAERLSDLPNCKEMQGKKNKGYYRIRFGDYRLGFKILDQQIVQLIDVGPRGDFYNRFP